MEENHSNNSSLVAENPTQPIPEPSRLHTATPLSKALAVTLFILLPFVGVYIGYTYAPEKIIERERIVTVGITEDEQQKI